MCGIAGYLGHFEPQLLPAMTTRIAHRGPDDYGEYLVAGDLIALGHRRLAIIDLAPSGHQPMTSADGRHVIVFNGEIYNYRELRRTLESQGTVFRGASDTEVLLELFALRGRSALPELSGMFAFAIWDSRAKVLTLARDGMGIKPLYYAQIATGFVFASELKALLTCREIPREYDREAIAHYLTYLWAPSPGTPLKAIRKLEPGEWLTVRDGRIDQRGKFYHLPPPAVGPRSVDETVAALDATLQAAVQKQLVSDVPIASFLSGGVDSSLVVALAKHASKEKLDCFTISVGDEPSVENDTAADLHYARRIASHLDVPLHEIPVESSQIQRDLEWMVEQLDEPQADPACLNAHYICRAARERGYKVMLSGTGGDDVFSGYRRHTALYNERFWQWLPRSARRAMSAATARSAASGSRGRRLAKAFLYADRDPINRLVGYFFWTHPTTTASLLPDLPIDVGAPLKSALDARGDIQNPLDQMLFLEARFFLGDHNLPYTDKMSMASGVEVRVPLIDTDVVKFAASIPPDLKQRGQRGKWILKQAARRYLPSDVLMRPKAGFGVPLRRWLNGPLKSWTNELLSPAVVRAIGLFDPDAVRRIQTETEEGRVDGTYTIFAVMCATLWHRKFLTPF